MIRIKNGYWTLEDESVKPVHEEQSPAELLREAAAQARIERKLGHKIMKAFKEGKELSELSLLFSIKRATILAHLRKQGVKYLQTCCDRLFEGQRTINEIIQLTGLSWSQVYQGLSHQNRCLLHAIVADQYSEGISVARIRSDLEMPRKFCYAIFEDLRIDIISELERKINGWITKNSQKAQSKSA